jgi:ubiquinone/menaquinone biosynthesis C-methylase UbiE
MNRDSNWKLYWEKQSTLSASDAEFDRGAPVRARDIESMAQEELLSFIAPRPSDLVFDAGCGTGSNTVALSSLVERIVAMDFAESAIHRCQRRIAELKIKNVKLLQGDISHTPLPTNSTDVVLCMSVFHYLDDQQVRATLREFHRLLKSGGRLILHVKNLTSLYLSTLYLAKRTLRMLGKETKLEHFRSFSWYANELKMAGFVLSNFNSFNLLMLDRMPRPLVVLLQRWELKNHRRFPMSTAFARRSGADLKLRAIKQGTQSRSAGSA